MEVILWTDGGMRGPNPGSYLYGSFAFNDQKQMVDHHVIGSNNESEYLSLIAGIEAVIREYGDVSGIILTVKTDSELIRNQIHGRWRIKAKHLKPLCNKAQALLFRFGKWRIDHVSRNKIVTILGH